MMLNPKNQIVIEKTHKQNGQVVGFVGICLTVFSLVAFVMYFLF